MNKYELRRWSWLSASVVSLPEMVLLRQQYHFNISRSNVASRITVCAIDKYKIPPTRFPLHVFTYEDMIWIINTEDCCNNFFSKIGKPFIPVAFVKRIDKKCCRLMRVKQSNVLNLQNYLKLQSKMKRCELSFLSRTHLFRPGVSGNIQLDSFICVKHLREKLAANIKIVLHDNAIYT